MQKLDILVKFAACGVVISVGYALGSFAAWVISLLGGICIGC